jgi:hypothetical protein
LGRSWRIGSLDEGSWVEEAMSWTGMRYVAIGVPGIVTLTANFEEAFRELAGVALGTCTQSKEATGHVLSIGLGTIKLVTGIETLNASSESSEA